MLFDAFIKDFQKLKGTKEQPAQPAIAATTTTKTTTTNSTAITANNSTAKAAITYTVITTDTASYYTVTTCHTIVDRKNNLEWYIADDKDYTYTDAQNWAAQLQVCNGGWSLPTTSQLSTLYQPAMRAGKGVKIHGQKFYARMHPVFGGIGHSSWVWTKDNIDEANAYTVNLNQGLKVISPKTAAGYPIRAFAVRKLNSPKPGL
jgi:hypothetical protein